MTNEQIKNIMSSKSDHWATPQQLIKRIQYDLDPCPFKHDITLWDGLNTSWYGTVFCNPPYSDIKRWVEKCLYEIEYNDDVKTIKLLVFAKTDTKWFHTLMESNKISKVVFFKGRLHFNETKGGTFSSILIYLVKGHYTPWMVFKEARGDDIL